MCTFAKPMIAQRHMVSIAENKVKLNMILLFSQEIFAVSIRASKVHFQKWREDNQWR